MTLSRLWSWWRKWRAPLGHLDVVMYTRRGCHLCETAWAELRRQRRRYGFRLAAVDVGADPELRRRHGHCVPVGAGGGRVRVRGAVNPVAPARLLRAEARRPNDRTV